ncbi:SGNH/GDSL hydrolase family protein [Chryseobacterium sp. G0240]|uniref:SGNH/GDSL hydrolase family protein n=1 Tax=Chryseobacterium sp. G0240 TaxID=2487066 RepID=UPI000F455F76|nr:SGNH/GDSL hydrolase family protein [Chryseobacterium sp. G0240]ROH98420.1 SGNH/GDSL hydrolase family protein [Chryseobacterium sp. G0240]
MATPINTILSWFQTGDVPTETQFSNSWISFWHKDERIPIGSVEGLSGVIDEKTDRSVFDSHLTNTEAHNKTLAKIDGSNLTESYIESWRDRLRVSILPENVATVDRPGTIGSVFTKQQAADLFLSKDDYTNTDGTLKETQTSIRNPFVDTDTMTIFYTGESGIEQRGVADLTPFKNSILNAANAGYKGYLNTDTPAPTEVGLYKLLQLGNYPNLTPAEDSSGNPITIVAENGKINEAYFNGTVWNASEITLPQANNNIPLFNTLIFPVSAPTQTVYNNLIWQVKEGSLANIGDIPSESQSSKWLLIGESVTEKSERTIIVKNDNYTTNSYFTNTNVFSGFGFDFGIIKDFNQIIIKVGQIVGTSNPVTEVNIRICEGSYTGTELAKVTKSVTIAEGDIQDVSFDLPAIITNNANHNIWIEFWANGKTGLFKGNTSTAVNYRYKTVAMSYGDFNVQSSASEAQNFKFYIVAKKVINVDIIKNILIADEVLISDERPVKSSAVAKVTKKYDAVIVDGFQSESEAIIGNENINVQHSTFKGWGQLRGVLSNFNRIGFILRAFDQTMIPTEVRCIIRKNSNTGVIIFDQSKPISLELNVNKKVYFDLPESFVNTNNDEIFISFICNGMIALLGGQAQTDYDSAHSVKYTTSTTATELISTVTVPRYQMYVEVLRGTIVKQISDSESDRIAKLIGGFNAPDLLLTSRVWLYPGFQYNIFEPNVCIPEFGDNNFNYRLDFDSTIGKQGKRGFRLDPIPSSLTTNLNLTLLKGRRTLNAKAQLLLSAAVNNGDGLTRKACITGDSTVDHDNITQPLKAIFDNDLMNIEFIGTRGNPDTLHEGIAGAKIVDRYGPGIIRYKIDVTELTTPPEINSRYIQGVNEYNVDEVNMSGGNGYFSVSIVTGAEPLPSGTLSKKSGNGDLTITYLSMTIQPANKFYDPSVGKFSLEYYLTTTGQTLGNNDWFFWQIGINDVFGALTLPDAQARVEIMITQLNEMIANIHSYNSTIRIGIVVTFPPAGQDGFAANYGVKYMSELYIKTGLITWQKRLIQEYDNQTALNNRIYLISAHLNLDTVNNFPTVNEFVNSRSPIIQTIQSNGVHPSNTGYAQIADMYAGLIKYYA